MKYKNIFTNFLGGPYFTKQDLVVLSERFEIPSVSLNTLIQRAVKEGSIVPLKRNYYVTKEFLRRNRSKIEYKFYLANILLKPSYLSRETALNYYGLLSEAVRDYYTCITTKTTREFNNALGVYEYKSIRPESFHTYRIVKFKMNEKEYSYAIAEPYKAIYDYLYFRIRARGGSIKKDALVEVLDELRINYTVLTKQQMDNLLALFKHDVTRET